MQQSRKIDILQGSTETVESVVVERQEVDIIEKFTVDDPEKVLEALLDYTQFLANYIKRDVNLLTGENGSVGSTYEVKNATGEAIFISTIDEVDKLNKKIVASIRNPGAEVVREVHTVQMSDEISPVVNKKLFLMTQPHFVGDKVKKGWSKLKRTIVSSFCCFICISSIIAFIILVIEFGAVGLVLLTVALLSCSCACKVVLEEDPENPLQTRLYLAEIRADRLTEYFNNYQPTKDTEKSVPIAIAENIEVEKYKTTDPAHML